MRVAVVYIFIEYGLKCKCKRYQPRHVSLISENNCAKKKEALALGLTYVDR